MKGQSDTDLSLTYAHGDASPQTYRVLNRGQFSCLTNLQIKANIFLMAYKIWVTE
jgi:hypothetical protein